MISSASLVSALPRIPVHRNRHRSAPGDPRGGGVPGGVILEGCRTGAMQEPLFTEVRGIRILRTSPFGDSPKFAHMEFSEVRLMPLNTNIAHLGCACPRLGV